ncbi:cytochrome P450 [Streptomyces hirsutus]|uniref:cytochrome P450 n=1 Tax=Streptomyces hirsutus TaxID=35620 RepID=UPI0033DA59B6
MPPHAARARERNGLFTTLLTAETPLSRGQLQDEAITLSTGAIETTGTTLAWTLYEVTRSPESERRLRDELASVCSDRPLHYDDMEHLPYARQVLQEVVRKYGPAWMVTRTATRDIHLGTHRIAEGADVVWSPYLHQHDPEHFPDPDCFAPDRWTPERAPTARGSFLASATDAAHVSARTSLGPSCRSSCRPTCSSGPAWSSPPAPHAPKPSPPSNPTQ